MELKLYRIFDGENHWYSASDIKNALDLHASMMGAEEEVVKISEIHYEKYLTVKEEEGNHVTKSAREWAKEGPGLIASSCY